MDSIKHDESFGGGCCFGDAGFIVLLFETMQGVTKSGG
jgi:hypothetical protein